MTDVPSIVPDDFDLEAARRRKSSTPATERERCPNCGARDLFPRGRGTNEDVPRYQCPVCLQKFDQPVSQEGKADA